MNWTTSKDRLNFGRYEGETIDEVWEKDPSYICWSLNKRIIKLNSGNGNCEEAVENYLEVEND